MGLMGAMRELGAMGELGTLGVRGAMGLMEGTGGGGREQLVMELMGGNWSQWGLRGVTGRNHGNWEQCGETDNGGELRGHVGLNVRREAVVTSLLPPPPISLLILGPSLRCHFEIIATGW